MHIWEVLHLRMTSKREFRREVMWRVNQREAFFQGYHVSGPTGYRTLYSSCLRKLRRYLAHKNVRKYKPQNHHPRTYFYAIPAHLLVSQNLHILLTCATTWYALNTNKWNLNCKVRLHLYILRSKGLVRVVSRAYALESLHCFSRPPKGSRKCLMSPPCLESQGCHLIPLCYLLSCSSA